VFTPKCSATSYFLHPAYKIPFGLVLAFGGVTPTCSSLLSASFCQYFTYFFFFVIWVKYTNFLSKDMHGCQNRFGSDTDGEFGTPQGIEQLVAV
jgi:hypothetical protein